MFVKIHILTCYSNVNNGGRTQKKYPEADI